MSKLRLRHGFIVAIILCTLFSLTSVTYGQDSASSLAGEYDWPMFHFDVGNTGNSRSTAPENVLIWSYLTGGSITSSPIISEGRVFVGSLDNYVYSLDENSGEMLWRFKAGDQIYLSSGAVHNGNVIIGSVDTRIYCLDGEDGEIVWTFKTSGPVVSSPGVVDDRVYVGSSDGYLYSIDAFSGELQWKYNTEGYYIYSSPAIVDGKVYFGAADGKVYCLSAVTGNLIWSYQTEGAVLSSPAVTDDAVYVGASDGALYSLDSGNGALLWRFYTGGDIYTASPAVSQGKVFIGSADDWMYSLDADTGAQIWGFKTEGDVYSSPAVAGGYVYFGSHDNKVYCLDIETGEKVWDIYINDGFIYSSPGIANGKLFIGSSNGRIYSYGNTGVSLEYPKDDAVTQGEVSLVAKASQGESPLEMIDVKFYVDSTLIGSSKTNSTGHAVIKFEGETGAYRWYATTSIDGNVFTSNIYEFSATKFSTLRLNSELGEVSGAGSFLPGTTVTFSVSPTYIEEENARHSFEGWSSNRGYTGTDSSATVTMQGDITETAEWTTQYYWAIEAENGGIVSPSSGWFDEGERITFTLIPDPGFKLHVDRPAGITVSPDGTTGVATVSGAKSLVFNFEPIQYYDLQVLSEYGETSGSGEYAEGSQVRGSVIPLNVSIGDSTHFLFDGWENSGVGGYRGDRTSFEITLNNDVTEKAIWKPMYKLTIVSSIETAGDGWYQEGETVIIKAPTQTNLFFKPLFKSWTGSVESSQSTIQVTMDSPKQLAAMWGTDFTTAIIASVAGFAIVVPVGYNVINAGKKSKKLLDLESVKTQLTPYLSSNTSADLKEIASKTNVPLSTVVSTISQLIDEKVIDGWFSPDNSKFVPRTQLTELIKEKFSKED